MTKYSDCYEVMSDEAWSWSPTNGNPIPKAECGNNHEGKCCCCISCCN